MTEPITILLAEDNPDDVLLVKMALAKAGVTGPIHVVRDGAEAIAYLQGAPPFEDRAAHPLPRLLLLDLKMPRLNGFAILEWVKTRPELSLMVVAVLSGSEWPHDLDRAYALGAHFYILKPFDFQVLAEKLEHLVQLIAIQIASLGAKNTLNQWSKI